MTTEIYSLMRCLNLTGHVRAGRYNHICDVLEGHLAFSTVFSQEFYGKIVAGRGGDALTCSQVTLMGD